AVAEGLGLEVRAELMPEDKLRIIGELRRAEKGNQKVAMVGDGVNDAPVLAQADVSIAMSSGAFLAQAQADAVLLTGSLEDLAATVGYAARTLAVIRENLVWALAYNAVAVPLAVAGYVTPWIAGIGMSLSSLAVVANALRLRAFRAPPGEGARQAQGATA
ncbi:HAD-IC family P-type ATPase, partial [Tepidiforma sp.]|uniref:HAD-IC family P-type ATPase n=1 Tax=Tepidiforma sp. TaxID=2682230 RepID=UPI00262E2D58